MANKKPSKIKKASDPACVLAQTVKNLLETDFFEETRNIEVDAKDSIITVNHDDGSVFEITVTYKGKG